MIICLLGRQPELSLAELDALYPDRVKKLGHEFALVDTPENTFDIQRMGGVLKAGVVDFELPDTDWTTVSNKIARHFHDTRSDEPGKLTLGISAYGFRGVRPAQITDLGVRLKKEMKPAGVNIRLIPNKAPVLSTASSHHNKLGLSRNKAELLIVKVGKTIFVASSTGTQNITAYANRDQARPARDAFVGMLPPKLAQIMLNLALGQTEPSRQVLDPFCGTGVVLQEALLMRHDVYGSDLSDKMVDYTTRNLAWLAQTHTSYTLGTVKEISQADATKAHWPYGSRLDVVVCEGYLGQPFSATPTPAKLNDVRGNCEHIMGSFLANIARQIKPGTRLCVAVPAWRDLKTGTVTRLPLTTSLSTSKDYVLTNRQPLLYYREDQVVARDILVLIKK